MFVAPTSSMYFDLDFHDMAHKHVPINLSDVKDICKNFFLMFSIADSKGYDT